MVEPGRRMLGDRYDLDRLIAAGGMGQVWRATDLLLHRPVAVKVLRSEFTGDPTFLARFRAEAQHAAALSHPNIAAVYDYGETTARDAAGDTGERLAYLVMELVEGRPLSALLQQEGRLGTAVTLSVLGQTAAALAEAHRAGLVHRDVKPGNILVRSDGSVKITDFGIAWSAGSVPLTRTGQVIGTPQYLSPEQAEGHLATPASDVYALGLVGYECLAGRPAFDGDNVVTIALKQLREDPQPLPDELPAGVRTLVLRALAKDPAARMRDGAAFAAAVEDVRAGRLPDLPPLPAPDPAAATPAADAAGAATVAALPALGDARAGRPGSPPPDVAGSRRRPPAPRRRWAAVVLVPLVALLVGAGLAAAVLSAVADGAPPTVVAARTQEERAGVLLEAADHLGRPVDDVATQLSALGLSVQRREQVTDRTVPGRVVGVAPTGVELEPGDDVVVTYAVAPPDPAPRTRGREDGDVSSVTGAGVPGRAPRSSAPPADTGAGSSAPPPATAPTTTAGTPSPSTTTPAPSGTPTPTGEPTAPPSPPAATPTTPVPPTTTPTTSSPPATTSPEPAPPSGGPSPSTSDSPGAGGGSPQV